MEFSFSLDLIRQWVEPIAEKGSWSGSVTGIAALDRALEGDLSFLGNIRYRKDLPQTGASVVLLPKDLEVDPPEGQCYLFVENPSYALGVVCMEIEKALTIRPEPGIHPGACVASDAEIGEEVSIGPFTLVESGVSIGAGTIVENGVTLGRKVKVGANCHLKSGVHVRAYCELGDRVLIEPGAVIGGEGFGYETVDGRHRHIPQIGRVVIESDVEIGSNTSIDRARFAETVIGEGTKIDSLVQIGHNVRVGKHCLIAGAAGIAGSSILDDYVMIGGQAGVAGHLHIGKGAALTAQAGTAKNIPPGAVYSDTPARPLDEARKATALTYRLEGLFQRVAELERSGQKGQNSSS